MATNKGNWIGQNSFFFFMSFENEVSFHPKLQLLDLFSRS